MYFLNGFFIFTSKAVILCTIYITYFPKKKYTNYLSFFDVDSKIIQLGTNVIDSASKA